MRHPILSLSLVFVAACGFEGGSDDTPDAGSEPDAGPTYEDADWLFEPDRLLRIEVDIDEANWDRLRFQARNIFEILGEDCGNAPTTSPFTYVEANVTVDGIEVDNVGIRKKGFLGSLDEDRPSLKIKFNEYVPGQKLTGTKRMTLNNAKQDPSLMNQCLGYALFDRAGVPAPRCNFASVRVNGRELGIYVHIESVKKPFLGRHFDDTNGNLYEGTLSDFRDGWTSTFERKTNKAEPPGSEDRSDIQAIVDALGLGDPAMVEELETLIDLDEFLRFWAVETMLSHWDGYSGNNNNFFIYADPGTGKFSFLPWGADQLFVDQTASLDVATTRSTLTRRLFLHPPTRDRYLALYRSILDDFWNEAGMLAEIDRVDALVASSVPLEVRAAYTDAVSTLRQKLIGRETTLRLNHTGASAADAESLSDPLCFDDVGTMASDFTVGYNSGVGMAITATVSIGGVPRVLSDIGVFIGESEEQEDSSVLFVAATDAGGKDVVFFVAIPNQLAVPGTIDVGAGLVESALLFTPPGATEPDELYFVGGALTLTAAAATQNAPWAGTLDVKIWDPPFL